MASLRDIRRRIASVQDTYKITRAMEMVAAAKLRRAQQRIESLRPYAVAMTDMMQDLARYAENPKGYALLRHHESVRTITLVVFTGDRGLAGAFNANVIRRAVELHKGAASGGQDTRWVVVGKKGVGTLGFRGYAPEKTWVGLSDYPDYTHAEDIARYVIDLYSSEQTDEVHLIYNRSARPWSRRSKT